jgi:hypothetical protein
MGRLNWDNPWTEFAKSLSPEEFRRHHPMTFWASWRLWGSYISLTLAFTHFPWSWLADSPSMQAFADFMAAMLPIIDELPSELRHRPFEASRVQMAFVHATGMVFAIWRVVTQPRPATREMAWWHSSGLATLSGLFLAYFLYHTFNHVGYAEGSVYAVHKTAVGATFVQGIHWLVIAFVGCCMKGLYQEFWYESVKY